jgi:hypothetical protein
LEAVRRPGAKAVCAARGRQVERNGHHQRAEAKGGKGRQRGLHFKTGFSRLDVCPIRALLFIENPYNAIEGAFPLLFPVLARENSSKERTTTTSKLSSEASLSDSFGIGLLLLSPVIGGGGQRKCKIGKCPRTLMKQRHTRNIKNIILKF